VLIADDLSGAADSGVAFARHGARVVVSWDLGEMADAEVVALSTESRHRTPEEARQRVLRALDGLAERDPGGEARWFYKKIDSTLRGHPGLELATLLERVGYIRALVVPAFPAQGRVTREGVHYVHGRPLAETVFGSEVGGSRVDAVLARGLPAAWLRHIPLARVREGPEAVAAVLGRRSEGWQVWIGDAETDEDLRSLAEAAHAVGLRVFCGAGGLAAALAEVLAPGEGWSPSSGAHQSLRWGPGAVWVVIGSRHPRSRRQAEVIRATGVPVVTPSLDGCPLMKGGETAHVVLLSATDLRYRRGHEGQIAGALAAHVHQAFKAGSVGALVVTGGETAMAVYGALGARALRLGGEVEPGIPWGVLMGGMAHGLPVVTKAGGFGDEDALGRAARFLLSIRAAWSQGGTREVENEASGTYTAVGASAHRAGASASAQGGL